MTACVCSGCKDLFSHSYSGLWIHLNSFQVSFSCPSTIRNSIVDLFSSINCLSPLQSELSTQMFQITRTESTTNQFPQICVEKLKLSINAHLPGMIRKVTRPAPRYYGGMTRTPSFLHEKEQCNTNKDINNTSRNSERRSAEGEGGQL